MVIMAFHAEKACETKETEKARRSSFCHDCFF